MEVNEDVTGTMQMVFDEVHRLREANFILTQQSEAKSEALKYAGYLLRAAHEKLKMIEDERGASVLNLMGPMDTVFEKVYSLKKANFLLNQKLAVNSEALKNSNDLLKAADEKVKKLQSIVAEQKDEIERLLKIDTISEHSQVGRSSMKTANTAPQVNVNIPDYNANCLQTAEAADKISRLEEALYLKRKYVTKLKNELTCYRLKKERDMRAKCNVSSVLEESHMHGNKRQQKST
jgi:hypothetical protein